MDAALRLQLLRACVRDRVFLNKCALDVRPEDFPVREESAIVEASVGYWEKYKEPVGPLLQSEVSDIARQKKYGAESRKKLKDLVASVQSGDIETVSVQALVDRVRALKVARFNEAALEKVISLHEAGELTGEAFGDIMRAALQELAGSEFQTSRIMSRKELRLRALRRSKEVSKKVPWFHIPPLDNKIKGIGRGELGLFLAPYKAGKGLALVHLAVAYAMQGWNVLLVTLEDPVHVVEDRFDAAISGTMLANLAKMPRRVRARFEQKREDIKGNIRVIDGTEGGWSVQRVEQAWNNLKQQKFEAGVVIVDYDDELVSDKQFKGEDYRRHEFAHIYRQLRQATARMNVIMWTAAQATRKAEGKRIVTGMDVAEDISKIRKVFLAIGIGRDEKEADIKHLYVIAHKTDKSRFGVDIVSDYKRAIFCDRDKTQALYALRRKDAKNAKKRPEK